VATAFRTAMSGRPGPVHLTLPIDIQNRRYLRTSFLSTFPRNTALWAAAKPTHR